MTNVRMKALDTLHLSGLGPDNLAAGDEFEVPGGTAEQLIARGLAERVEPEHDGAAKAAPAPENKMERTPANKFISAESMKPPAKAGGSA